MIYTFWRETASNQFFFSSSTNLFFSLEFAHFYEKWIILSRSEAITELRLFTIESSKDKTTILQDEFKHFFITVNVNSNQIRLHIRLTSLTNTIKTESMFCLIFISVVKFTNFFIAKLWVTHHESLPMHYSLWLIDKPNFVVQVLPTGFKLKLSIWNDQNCQCKF